MGKLQNKIKRFGKNKDNKELVLHSLIALTVRVGGAGAAFLMNVVIARHLGASESGYFFLAVTITTLLATISRIGADQTVLRFVSIHGEKGEWNKVNGLLSKMSVWTFIPISIITVIICLFTKQICIFFFGKPDLQWSLFWIALSMPFFAVCNIYSIALQGRKKVFQSVTSLKILTPLFIIILVFIFSPKDSSRASLYYTIACALNLVIAYYWWKKIVPPHQGKAEFDSSTLWKSSLPLWIITIMNQLMTWGGQLIAGHFNNSTELAQLAAARNTSVLVTFILTAVNYVSAPKFASLYSQGKMDELKKYARSTSLLMTSVALPVTLAVWIFPRPIMAMFGKDFESGINLLRILSIGQFVNVITGSTGYLLIMSGHEKDLRNIAIINGVAAIVLALILNPIFGVVGSAISTSLVLAGSNLMAMGKVKKRLGFTSMAINFNFRKSK